MHHTYKSFWSVLTFKNNIIVIPAIVLASLLLGTHFWERLVYELQGPLTADSTLYLGVGRGILNGLTPYADLFETKPPGVFLLASLSLWLTNGTLLIAILQAIGIVLVPIILLKLVRNLAQLENRTVSLAAQVLTVLLGTIWALYLAERSGEFQVESFGAVFAGLYLVLITHNQTTPMPRRRLLGASLLLLFAIGTKEPFLLTIWASALLIFAKSPLKIIDRLIKPGVIAAGLGTLLLIALQYFGAFFRIYLPEMLGRHVHARGPLWERALNWDRLVDDLEKFVPFLGYLTLVMLIAVLVTQFKNYQPLQRLAGVISVIGAILLTVLAVGLGGQYWNHHFVFAVPVYLTVSALFIVSVCRWQLSKRYLATTVGAITLLFFSANFPDLNLNSRTAAQQAKNSQAKNVAWQIDNILSACDYSRYLFLGGNGIHPYAYTKHSPLGPNFFQYHYFYSPERTLFRASLLNNLKATNLIVLDNLKLGELKSIANNYMAAHFTKIPWECASQTETQGKYTFLFRNDKSILLSDALKQNE